MQPSKRECDDLNDDLGCCSIRGHEVIEASRVGVILPRGDDEIQADCGCHGKTWDGQIFGRVR